MCSAGLGPGDGVPECQPAAHLCARHDAFDNRLQLGETELRIADREGRGHRTAGHRPAVIADDEVACILGVAVDIDLGPDCRSRAGTLEQRVAALGGNEEDVRLLVVDRLGDLDSVL